MVVAMGYGDPLDAYHSLILVGFHLLIPNHEINWPLFAIGYLV